MPEEPKKWNSFQKLRPKKGTVKRRFRKIESSSLKHAHLFIIQRWTNVLEVRRNAIAWLLLLTVLITGVAMQSATFASLYTTKIPDQSTAYSEGIVGSLDTLNPIFVTSEAERSASRLLFSGLLRYDAGNHISGDLAQSWQFIDGGKRVVVVLKPNLKWHDGQPITASDVVYTINMIKNTDTGSPLLSSWQGVSVKADADNRTIEFLLPFPYAAFLDSLTVGVLPEHILSKVAPVDLRNSSFNRAPIGSGPFKFLDIKDIGDTQQHTILSLTANPNYHLGRVKLSKFYIHAFATQDQLRKSFLTDEVNAAVNLDVQSIKALPADKRAGVGDSPLNDGTFAFFRTDSDILKDPLVRQALLLGTDQSAIIKSLGNHVTPMQGPLLASQLNDQASLPSQASYDFKHAESLLDQAGWVKDKNGVRMKNGQKLTLTLATSQSGDFPAIASTMSEEWNKLGINVQTQLVDPSNLQQNVIAPRAYDVLLYEVVLGRDPDVYAYWHSSQANASGLNLSDYHSGIVDDALESARARLEPDLRMAKYRVFYQQWIKDVPAIALFQPSLHYAENANVNALQKGAPIIDQIDRYVDVRDWTGARTIGYDTP